MVMINEKHTHQPTTRGQQHIPEGGSTSQIGDGGKHAVAAVRPVRCGAEREGHQGCGHEPVQGVRVRDDDQLRGGDAGHPVPQRLHARSARPASQLQDQQVKVNWFSFLSLSLFVTFPQTSEKYSIPLPHAPFPRYATLVRKGNWIRTTLTIVHWIIQLLVAVWREAVVRRAFLPTCSLFLAQVYAAPPLHLIPAFANFYLHLLLSWTAKKTRTFYSVACLDPSITVSLTWY